MRMCPFGWDNKLWLTNKPINSGPTALQPNSFGVGGRSIIIIIIITHTFSKSKKPIDLDSPRAEKQEVASQKENTDQNNTRL